MHRCPLVMQKPPVLYAQIPLALHLVGTQHLKLAILGFPHGCPGTIQNPEGGAGDGAGVGRCGPNGKLEGGAGKLGGF